MNFESEKSVDQILPEELEKLCFDDWKQLNERDPDQFNYYRKKMLEHQIALAPEDMQPRLRGLLFQLEGEAARARTPLSYNIRLSEMMIELVDKLRSQLQLICETQLVGAVVEKPVMESAEIIPFRVKEKY